MVVMGKNSSSIVRGVMLCLLFITLCGGGTNAFGSTVDDYLDAAGNVVDDYVHELDNQIHHALYPNDNVLMQWGTGVFIAIIVGIVVAGILICVCCGCMCYHCCCKTSPPPYTTLVVASNQPHPMAQPNQGVQMNMQPAPYGQQQPYTIKH